MHAPDKKCVVKHNLCNFTAGLSSKNCLLELLKEMETLENESHFCIQFPQNTYPIPKSKCGDHGQGTDLLINSGNITENFPQCIQQNYKLNCGVLSVEQESLKVKNITNTVLYLRVRYENFLF